MVEQRSESTDQAMSSSSPVKEENEDVQMSKDTEVAEQRPSIRRNNRLVELLNKGKPDGLRRMNKMVKQPQRRISKEQASHRVPQALQLAGGGSGTRPTEL